MTYFLIAFLYFFHACYSWSETAINSIKQENETLKGHRLSYCHQKGTYDTPDILNASMNKGRHLIMGKTSSISRNTYATPEDRFEIFKHIKHTTIIKSTQDDLIQDLLILDLFKDIEESFETKPAHEQRHLAALGFMQWAAWHSLKMFRFDAAYINNTELYQALFDLKQLSYFTDTFKNQNIIQIMRAYTLDHIKILIPEKILILLKKENPSNFAETATDASDEFFLRKKFIEEKKTSNTDASVFFIPLANNLFSDTFKNLFSDNALASILEDVIQTHLMKTDSIMDFFNSLITSRPLYTDLSSMPDIKGIKRDIFPQLQDVFFDSLKNARFQQDDFIPLKSFFSKNGYNLEPISYKKSRTFSPAPKRQTQEGSQKKEKHRQFIQRQNSYNINAWVNDIIKIIKDKLTQIN